MYGRKRASVRILARPSFGGSRPPSKNPVQVKCERSFGAEIDKAPNFRGFARTRGHAPDPVGGAQEGKGPTAKLTLLHSEIRGGATWELG